MYETLLIIGSTQTFLVACLLIFVQIGDSRQSKLLGAVIALYGLTFVQELEYLGGVYISAPILAPIMMFFYLLLGPVFYFYVKDLTSSDSQILLIRRYLHAAFKKFAGTPPSDFRMTASGVV